MKAGTKMKIPYKQVKTPGQKAAFYLGYVWSGLVAAGSIDPHKDAFLGDKEDLPYEDYRALFSKMADIVHTDNGRIGLYQYREVFKNALAEAARNLLEAEKENFGLIHATCFALGQATWDIARGEFITSAEAEERWGLKKGTVKASCGRGKLAELIPLRLVRKSGGTWLVTTAAMQAVYGQTGSK